jgi:outer membrane protein assembly factor BamB
VGETPLWGFAGHPLIDGEHLICLVGGAGSVAVAFDKKNGQEVWRALSAKEPGYCPPTLIEAGGTRQLLVWHTESLNSLNPRTGQLYWSEPLDPDYGMSIATPCHDPPYLFVGAIVMKSMALKLAVDRPAAEFLWAGRKDRGIGPAFSTPYAENGYMYGFDMRGELCCVKLETGEHLWSTLAATTGERGINNASAFLVKQEDRFFIFNEQGELILTRLSPDGYHEISRAKLLEPLSQSEGRHVVWSHPAFAQKCVFARNDREIVCYSLAK